MISETGVRSAEVAVRAGDKMSPVGILQKNPVHRMADAETFEGVEPERTDHDRAKARRRLCRERLFCYLSFY